MANFWARPFSVCYIDDTAGADTSQEAARTEFVDCGATMEELGLVQAKDKQCPYLPIM